MKLPDVNVLVYAFRSDTEHHAICRSWLSATVLDSAPFGISKLALSALIRVTTHPRIYNSPSPLDEALRFCDYLIEQPNCTVVEPGDRHWQIFKNLCHQPGIRANRITDAWFAALAIESGCEWITFDRDYGRFKGLKWSTP
jgi:uncharacterized protein